MASTVVDPIGRTGGRLLKGLLYRRGYKLIPVYPPDMGDPFKAEVAACKPYTMTSVERMFSLAMAVRFLVESKVAGDFVECGVWKGGSALLMARTLVELGVDDRSLWLYDTFSGMSEPTDADGRRTWQRWRSLQRDTHNSWCYSPIDEVRATMARSGYPQDAIHLVEGKVEDTIPRSTPSKVALLRLDTDWYESTRHELVHLWPRLAPGGILIIDDYGKWQGARRAVDEYFEQNGPVLLHRIDHTGRAVQKQR